MQSMNNNSYYMQCHTQECIKILEPLLSSPTPSCPKPRSQGEIIPANNPSAAPPASPSEHGIGSRSRPITVSSHSMAVPDQPKSARTRIQQPLATPVLGSKSRPIPISPITTHACLKPLLHKHLSTSQRSG